MKYDIDKLLEIAIGSVGVAIMLGAIAIVFCGTLVIVKELIEFLLK